MSTSCMFCGIHRSVIYAEIVNYEKGSYTKDEEPIIKQVIICVRCGKIVRKFMDEFLDGNYDIKTDFEGVK